MNLRRRSAESPTLIRLKTLPLVKKGEDTLGTTKTIQVDDAALERELRKTLAGEVRFDGATRGMYAHDASNYREVPIGVVFPKDIADVEATVAAARKHGAPLLCRGGGTSIPGQGTNVALMMDFSRYLNSVIDIDAKHKLARVEPGAVCDTIREEAVRYGLMFGPDPATHSRCNIGGMIGNNSCGVHSVLAGRTSDNVQELDILLYDGTRMRVGPTSDQELEQIIAEGGRKGEIYGKLRDLRDKYAEQIRAKFPNIPRRVSGYNLDELLPENGFNVARALVGSEGTCAVTLEATLNLIDWPKKRVLVVAGFPNVYQAGDYVARGLEFEPMALEGMDDTFISCAEKKGMHLKDLSLLPDGRAWLFVEFGGDTVKAALEKAKPLEKDLASVSEASCRVFDDPTEQQALWLLRESGLGATAKVPGEPENHEGWEDTAVHPKDIGRYLRDFHALLAKYGYKGPLYGHFGDGCVHTRLNFDFETREGIDAYRSFCYEGTELCMRYNGSLSGEHGDGQTKGELLGRMFGEELIQAFAEFKAIWDPDWRMNPGKLVAPWRIDENLSEGTQWIVPEVETHFRYPNDHYTFADAANRCVGAGVCRRTKGGTMCPSYMVTREERHSTRGRARLLYEMLLGDTIKDGWRSEEVKEALDLCLACKGCKSECPVQVDMATYKAEFLSHFYKNRVRPRHAYAFGLIHVWATFASIAPEVANLFTRLPGLKRLAKRAVGMTEQREIPAFASYTFKQWFRSRKARRTGGKRVILWADTFNNHFHPTTAQAATEVLESAGFEVIVPMQNLCCGRPLYDYGMLRTAKKWMRDILNALRVEIRAGTPIVALEPSCAATFRDELLNLFPHDKDAKRLASQVFLLSEFLRKKAPDWTPPKLDRKALVHGHCHHKSIMGMDDEMAILKEMGVSIEAPDSGCCGMAGAFGFEEGDHYSVSIACGERVLLPEVRDADKDTLIIADGFSCREQIAQTTDRRAVHLAQVLSMAMKEGERGLKGSFPERKLNKGTPPAEVIVKRIALYVSVAALVGGAIWLGTKKKRGR